MCGIIAAFNKTIKDKKDKIIKAKPVNQFILNQYENQFSRGTKGFGIIRINNNGKVEIDRACEPTKFIVDLNLHPSNMIIAHHRFPTSTDNKIDQTHPMYVNNPTLKYDYYIVHNGIVRNDDDLKEKHEELGFTYSTEYTEKYSNGYSKGNKFNDSEALAIELALFIEGKINAIGTDDSCAFIVLQVEKKKNKAKRIYFGRNGFSSSLNINKTKGKIEISSEGEGKEVKENKLFSFETKDPEMKLSSRSIQFKEKEIKQTTYARETELDWRHTHKHATPTTQVLIPEINKTNITIENKTSTNEETKNTKMVELTNQEKKELGIPTSIEIRTWVDEDDAIEEAGYAKVIYSDAGYKTLMCKELKEKLRKATDTYDIKLEIENSLEEELDKISELIANYKDILLQTKIGEKEIDFFTEQIKNLMSTMKTMTNMGQVEYDTMLEKEEEEKKVEDDVRKMNDEYFDSIGMGFRNQKDLRDVDD